MHQRVLTFSYKEITDYFWDRVFHCSQNKREILIYSHSELVDETSFFGLWWWACELLALILRWTAWTTWTTWSSWVLLNFGITSDDFRSVIFVFLIVSKQIVLL